MCLRRAPEKYIAGAVLDRAVLNHIISGFPQAFDRPSYRRLLAKLVAIFADRWCHMVSVTDPYGRFLGSLDRSRYSFFQAAPHEAEWTPLRPHYFSINLVAPGIGPEPLDL
jgi:hypothetical protein